MRFQTITATSMQAALAELRATLGPGAIILSSEEGCNGNITLRAAIEYQPSLNQNSISPAPAAADSHTAISLNDALQEIARALAYHRAPDLVAAILKEQCSAFDAEYPDQILAAALELRYSFAPLPLYFQRPVLLFGPPGSGKTLTAAKLAARSLLAGHTPRLITADLQRAGGAGQLLAYARPMNIPLLQAADGKALAEIVKTAAAPANVIIDSMGVLAYDASEMRSLENLIRSVDCEPILVLSAACDAEETYDLVNHFAQLGAAGMIITRVDATRRLGSILGALEAAAMTLHHLSLTPYVANGLASATPNTLARILLDDSKQHDALIKMEHDSP